MKLLNTRRRAAAGIATVSLTAAALAGTVVVTGANGADPTTFSGVVLGVGADETARTVAWYSSATPTGATVELSTTSDFATTKTFDATVASNVTSDAATGNALTSANGKATLTGLQPSTKYYYRIKTADGAKSAYYTFKTGTFGNGGYQFLFFGDPQIGSSGDPVLDGDGWQYTLDQTKIHSPKAELYVSGGDQVNTANNETEWTQFLRPSELRSIPWAATIGNHDVSGYAYEQHFALPSTIDRSDPLYTNAAKKGPAADAVSGGDYFFTYKGVLFIDLNSNAYSATTNSDPAHVEFVRNTITRQKAADPDIKHVVLVYHHAIYSPADHANDTDNIQRRTDFTKSFSDLGVDLVLQGHDHSYSRSYAIKGSAESPSGAKANAAEQPGQTTVVEGPGGVIYVTANSASGSKFYDLTEPDATKGGYGADTLKGGPETKGHTRHWANSVENQEHVPTYIEVSVTDKGLTVKNVRSGDGDSPNAAVQRGNVTGIGPNLAGTPAPIGSLVDQVHIYRSQADVPVVKPPTKPTVHLVGAAPKVNGTARVGKRLTVTAGHWTAGTKLTYQWLADGKPIKGATGTSLKLTKKLKGKKVSVRVTGSLAGAVPSSLVKTSGVKKVK
ncbi:metallophosphoesterase family protein [Nocardioides sp. CER19]|uniref:metallophosphoesterase family protein n=1 Tax=Nocardioides sp. CER19 TaxID=3038538 RepID=UPI002448C65B|nr:metallophosphoesterase family protein [Nocardioides sp. CER19]MDH2416876.1 metallophosphoesterase family protein [Nocardioides sp. CER19]